jgi:hypothetical protein
MLSPAWLATLIIAASAGDPVLSSVVDRLAEFELPVTPYNGGEAPIDKERFVNARAEDDWTVRERFEQGEIDIAPDDDRLAAQLGAIKWASTHEAASRSNRRTTCACVDCLPGGPAGRGSAAVVNLGYPHAVARCASSSLMPQPYGMRGGYAPPSPARCSNTRCVPASPAKAPAP